MKRLLVALLVVVISILVVVAPASAATVLHGTWTGGVATQEDGTTVDLVTSGPGVIFVFGAKAMAVAGNVVIAAAPEAPTPPPDQESWWPFPLRWQMAWLKWDPVVQDGSSYTATFRTISILPPFTGTLVANTETHELILTVLTPGSDWGWANWVLYGELL